MGRVKGCKLDRIKKRRDKMINIIVLAITGTAVIFVVMLFLLKQAYDGVKKINDIVYCKGKRNSVKINEIKEILRGGEK